MGYFETNCMECYESLCYDSQDSREREVQLQLRDLCRSAHNFEELLVSMAYRFELGGDYNRKSIYKNF